MKSREEFLKWAELGPGICVSTANEIYDYLYHPQSEDVKERAREVAREIVSQNVIWEEDGLLEPKWIVHIAVLQHEITQALLSFNQATKTKGDEK